MESGMRIWVKFIVALLFVAVIAAATGRPLSSSCSGTQCNSVDMEIRSRSVLAGPGSQRPTCIGKCGPCKPCKPVLKVLKKIPGGGGSSPSYFPGRWKCRCNHKNYPPV